MLTLGLIPYLLHKYIVPITVLAAYWGIYPIVHKKLSESIPIKQAWEKLLKYPFMQPLFKGEIIKLKSVTDKYFDVPSNGRTVSDYVGFKEAIEGALQLHIGKIHYADDFKSKIRFQYSKEPLPRHINVADMPFKKGQIIFGYTISGWYSIKLSEMKHTLVVGKSGTGKTKFMQNYIVQAYQAGCKVCIIDKKSVGFAKFRGLENILYVNTVEGANTVLKRLQKLMYEREKLFLQTDGMPPEDIDEYKEVTGKRLARYLLVLDEAISVYVDSQGNSKGIYAENLQLTSEIAQKGRAFGIILLIGTQYANSKIFGPVMMVNIEHRIAFKTNDSMSIMVFAKATAGRMEFIPGRALFLDKDEQLIEFQTPLWERKDFMQFLQKKGG